MVIVGREAEKKQLEKIYRSNQAEFVVVYGRRRVGKTYLIREFFKQKKTYFLHVTGTYNANMSTQIAKFTEELSKVYFNGAPLTPPKTWDGIFELLSKQLQDKPDDQHVFFLDELPWLATRRSDLLSSLEHTWNRHWVQYKNVKLIVCGSSASWMIKKIIYDKGGLHNRATAQICLQPFTLNETKAFLKFWKIKLNQKNLLAIYMAIGGIPYYLKYLESGLTAAENIQQLFFNPNAPLRDEFNKLFDSLFTNANSFKELVTIIANNPQGVSRAKLIKEAKLSTNGGRLSEKLDDLCRAGFIEERISWKKNQGEYYKVIDEFCVFYLHWVRKVLNKKLSKNYWQELSQSQSYKIWAGLAFETVCFKHIDQILSALNVTAAATIDSWQYLSKKKSETGAQIDLLIERADDVIMICEIKYYNQPYSIDKSTFKALQDKINVFQTKTNTTKQIFFVMITANGLKENQYSRDLVDASTDVSEWF